jgi:hypothetical protein
LAQPLFTVAGNAFNAGTLADTLLLASILYAVWRYETEQRNRQTLLDEEFRNAQELQRVLIPSALPEMRCFAASSAYHPAQEVGGDFFQIMPNVDDSVLVSIGDVSGKGLRAAMAVSLIVGALRTLAEVTTDPAQVLAGLNRRLDGRLPGGFATCLVALLYPDGRCVFANAGHLPPFLNARQVELPGALPLGLNPNERYENQEVVLAPGDRLTLYTDGLLEARDSSGELFGFERVTELVGNAPGAEDAVAAGVPFGQEDDITVLTVTLMPRNVPAKLDRATVTSSSAQTMRSTSLFCLARSRLPSCRTATSGAPVGRAAYLNADDTSHAWIQPAGGESDSSGLPRLFTRGFNKRAVLVPVRALG